MYMTKQLVSQRTNLLIAVLSIGIGILFVVIIALILRPQSYSTPTGIASLLVPALLGVLGVVAGFKATVEFITYLISTDRQTITIDQSATYFYVPSDERNLENGIAKFSAFLFTFTIHSSSETVIHSIDMLIDHAGSWNETINCGELGKIPQFSEHTADWIEDFRKHHPDFQKTTIKETSEKISVPKCSVTMTPMRGYSSPGELPYKYVIVVLQIHTFYLWLLCEVYEMSPSIHKSVIISHKESDDKDRDKLEEWANKHKKKVLNNGVTGETLIRIYLR